MRLLSAAAIAIASLAAGDARATGVELYGFGERASGMGLTGGAAASDAAALYYNPAGLAGISDVEFSAGYRRAPTTLTLNGRSVGAREARASQLAIGFGVSTFGRRAGLALAAHAPDTGLYGVRLRAVHEPQWVVVDPRRERLHAMAGYGIELVDLVEAGISVSVLASTVTRTRITFGSSNDATMDGSLVPTHTFHGGVRAGPFGGARVGLSYREEHVSVLSFPTTITAEVGSIDGDIVVQSRSLFYYTPQQWTLGTAWERGPLTLAGDLVASRWSTMPDPYGKQVLTVIDRGGNLPETAPPRLEVDPRFRDTVSAHAGAQWKVLLARAGVHLRGGYAYVPTPAPRPSASRNLVDCDRHVLTAGVSVRWADPPVLTGPLSLDAHVLHARLVERTVTRADPADPVGAYTAGGELWSMGMTVSVGFATPYLRGER